MSALSLAFMALTFGVFALYGAAAGWLRGAVIERRGVLAWLRRSFAAGFGLLAAKLAATEV
jgi:threonine/homoserine/homoserine lactone efflux protein